MIDIKICLPTEALEVWEDIQKVPLFDITHETCLARVLLGQYMLVRGYQDDEPVGLAILLTEQDKITVIALYAPNVLREFKQAFFDNLKKAGVKKVVGYSTYSPKSYERLTGMKFKYACYEKVLK